VLGQRLINCIILKFEGKKTYDVDFEPWGRKHIVNITSFRVVPIVADLSQLVSDDVVISVEQCVHVRVQALWVVYSLLIKLNLNEVIRVSYKLANESLLPSTKFTSFQSDNSSLFMQSTMSFIRLLLTTWIGLLGPEGKNSP